VAISNITTRTDKVSPISIIAELQAVTVDLLEPTPVIQNTGSNFQISKENLSEEDFC
jgi:hypothetical protein